MPSAKMPRPGRVSDALLKRRTPIKRTAPPKRVNVKRKEREFARCYGSKERVEWVKSQSCVVKGGVHEGRMENSHIVTGGTRRKADYDLIVPMCKRHHWVFHEAGRARFQEWYSIALAPLAAETEARWQRHQQAEVA